MTSFDIIPTLNLINKVKDQRAQEFAKEEPTIEIPVQSKLDEAKERILRETLITPLLTAKDVAPEANTIRALFEPFVLKTKGEMVALIRRVNNRFGEIYTKIQTNDLNVAAFNVELKTDISNLLHSFVICPVDDIKNLTKIDSRYSAFDYFLNNNAPEEGKLAFAKLVEMIDAGAIDPATELEAYVRCISDLQKMYIDLQAYNIFYSDKALTDDSLHVILQEYVTAVNENRYQDIPKLQQKIIERTIIIIGGEVVPTGLIDSVPVPPPPRERPLIVMGDQGAEERQRMITEGEQLDAEDLPQIPETDVRTVSEIPLNENRPSVAFKQIARVDLSSTGDLIKSKGSGGREFPFGSPSYMKRIEPLIATLDNFRQSVDALLPIYRAARDEVSAISPIGGQEALHGESIEEIRDLIGSIGAHIATEDAQRANDLLEQVRAGQPLQDLYTAGAARAKLKKHIEKVFSKTGVIESVKDDFIRLYKELGKARALTLLEDPSPIAPKKKKAKGKPAATADTPPADAPPKPSAKPAPVVSAEGLGDLPMTSYALPDTANKRLMSLMAGNGSKLLLDQLTKDLNTSSLLLTKKQRKKIMEEIRNVYSKL